METTRIRSLIALMALAVTINASAQTTNNDDSCDIGPYPAATLLLPYFEVNVAANPGAGSTTLFSITNVSAYPQIARVTLWTDWSFPVITFNIFLTGYDVQPINLYDIIVRGVIGSTRGTGTDSPNARTRTGQETNPYMGTQPLTNLANPNFLLTAATDCAPGRLPGILPSPVVTDVRALFTVGRSTGAAISCAVVGEYQVGGNHGPDVAIGYATVDIVATCSRLMPVDRRYFEEILFDNVLIGDYQHVMFTPEREKAVTGASLVHIRAMPEGGGAGSIPTGVTNLPYTFYDRYTTGSSDRRIDRRQPLPSTFAARWISGTTGVFETQYRIWREVLTDSTAGCNDYVENSNVKFAEMVRFDERENANTSSGCGLIGPPGGCGAEPGLPSAARVPVWGSTFPANSSTDAGGWMYMNLSNAGAFEGAPYSAARDGYGRTAGTRDVSQNWVTVAQSAQGGVAVEDHAMLLGNGCSQPVIRTPAGGRVGPSGGLIVCPPGTTPTNGDMTRCVGHNTNP